MKVQDQPYYHFIKKFFFQYLFIFEREKECKLGRSRETEGDRRSKAGSALSAQCQYQSRTKDLWDHDLRWSQMLNPLSQPGGPILQFKSSYNPGFDMARIRSFWPLSICWYLKKHPLSLIIFFQNHWVLTCFSFCPRTQTEPTLFTQLLSKI